MQPSRARRVFPPAVAGSAGWDSGAQVDQLRPALLLFRVATAPIIASVVPAVIVPRNTAGTLLVLTSATADWSQLHTGMQPHPFGSFLASRDLRVASARFLTIYDAAAEHHLRRRLAFFK